MGKLEEPVRTASSGKSRPSWTVPASQESWQDRGLAMDGLRELLEDFKQHGYARGNFLGLLNVLIGRRVAREDGTVLSTGVTWRVLAEELKRTRWDKDDVQQLGLEPRSLPPRDRQRYWYQAIAQAGVDSPEGRQAGDTLAQVLNAAGYVVGPAPQ